MRSIARLILLSSILPLFLIGSATHHPATVSIATASVDPVLTQGMVLDAAGSPAPSAEVDLYVLNSEDNAPLNTAVSLPVVSSATTASDGSYTLTAPTDLAAVAADNGGYVNFEVDTVVNSVITPTFFSAEVVDSGGTMSWSPGQALALPTQLRSKPTVGVRLSKSASTRLASTPNIDCQNLDYPVRSWIKNTTVGVMHTAGDSKSGFGYGTSASTDGGVGVDFGGNGWKVSGSAHVGNNLSNSATWSQGADRAQQVKTQFRFTKFKRLNPCYGLVGYLIKPVKWLGGATYSSADHSLDHRCSTKPKSYVAPFGKGTSWTKDQAHALTFSGAASFSFITLSAQSGWNRMVHEGWHFGRNSSVHYLCGNNGSVTVAPLILAGS